MNKKSLILTFLFCALYGQVSNNDTKVMVTEKQVHAMLPVSDQIHGQEKIRTAKYFTATWCGPCKDFKPIILELISEGYNITVHDVDQDQNLPSQYSVYLIPTTVIEENGVEVDRFVGALPKLQVIQRLKR